MSASAENSHPPFVTPALSGLRLGLTILGHTLAIFGALLTLWISSYAAIGAMATGSFLALYASKTFRIARRWPSTYHAAYWAGGAVFVALVHVAGDHRQLSSLCFLGILSWNNYLEALHYFRAPHATAIC